MNGLREIALVTLACSSAFGASTRPVDCLPDRVVAWQAAAPAPETRFGADLLPGIVLGPPGDSTATTGAVSVASLGLNGSVTLAWDDLVIEDRPGADFTIFENAFFVGAVAPQSADDPYVLFAEPARVEVSIDGATWHAFPIDEAALAAAGSSTVDRARHLTLANVAGVTPTVTGNWTVPEDPASFDVGPGGLAGAGGDAFDLADVGLSEARYVRIVDAGFLRGFPGPAEGFDLDAVVVHHGRPIAAIGVDTDGDGLPDAAEPALYGTDPELLDSDGDGLDDGREAAGCRDGRFTAPAAVPPAEPALWLLEPTCTELRWTFPGTGVAVDALRGDLADLASLPDRVDLGAVTCLEAGITTVRWTCDAEAPARGAGFFYLVGRTGGSWGYGSSFLPRGPGGCP